MNKSEKEEKKLEKIKKKTIEAQRTRVYNEMIAYEKKHKRERKVAPKDAYISLQNINKIYDNKVQAVYDFNLKIKKHEFIVFVGPSGCGKSTTLRMIAGLEDITAGDLYIDGTYANDLEPKNRDIAMVFQSYALYPHMTVAGNMAFGLKIRKVPTLMKDKDGKPIKKIAKGLINDLKYERKNLTLYLEDLNKENADKTKIDEINKDIIALDEKIKYLTENPVDYYANRHIPKEDIRKRVLDAAKILQITEYLDRKPKALSGGQCQRVALGRAIVRNAKVFLMDEPLSNLDAKLRVQMRSEIIKLHNNLEATTIYVTHDQTEAMTMATRIVVMSKGFVQQIGTPIEIYNHPVNLFVATFIGSPSMNLYDCSFYKNEVVFNSKETLKINKEYNKIIPDFFDKSLAEYENKKENLLKNFVERNLIIDKIKNLESSSDKNEKIVNEIARLKENLIHVTAANEALTQIEKDIAEYKAVIKSKKYPIVFGIRPEDIYDVNDQHLEDLASKPFKKKIILPELLGNEYFIHVSHEDKDMVAKINAKKIWNSGEEINLVFDLSKVHIFDKISTKLIK